MQKHWLNYLISAYNKPVWKLITAIHSYKKNCLQFLAHLFMLSSKIAMVTLLLLQKFILVIYDSINYTKGNIVHSHALKVIFSPPCIKNNISHLLGLITFSGILTLKQIRHMRNCFSNFPLFPPYRLYLTFIFFTFILLSLLLLPFLLVFAWYPSRKLNWTQDIRITLKLPIRPLIMIYVSTLLW
jgi:hypothetical protein